MSTIYTAGVGCTTYVNGERGTTTGFTREHGSMTGAFVKLDERPAMLFVVLGPPANPCTCGAEAVGSDVHHRNAVTGVSFCDAEREEDRYHEIATSYEIDREEFDRLSGLAELREEFGWR